MSYWYLATPYSKVKDGRGVAFARAAEQCSLLNRQGWVTFSPIVHCHHLKVHEIAQGASEYEAWRAFNESFMYHACGLIVCKLPGWITSEGVREEIKYFCTRFPQRPIKAMTPGSVDLVEFLP